MMSLDRSYDPRTLDDLASLVASARRGIKPLWQHAGIRSALIEAAQRGPMTLADLAHAALTVAGDQNAQTPARIAHDGPWWRSPVATTTDASGRPRYPASDDCATCNHPAGQHPWLGCDEYLHPRQHQPIPQPKKHATRASPRSSATRSPTCGTSATTTPPPLTPSTPWPTASHKASSNSPKNSHPNVAPTSAGKSPAYDAQPR